MVGSPAQPIKDFFRQIAKLKKMTKREDAKAWTAGVALQVHENFNCDVLVQRSRTLGRRRAVSDWNSVELLHGSKTTHCETFKTELKVLEGPERP